jgi:hypothetical protein
MWDQETGPRKIITVAGPIVFSADKGTPNSSHTVLNTDIKPLHSRELAIPTKKKIREILNFLVLNLKIITMGCSASYQLFEKK